MPVYPRSVSKGGHVDELNPAQRRAAEHGLGPSAAAGPLLIIAGAGSGKTATIAHRVARLIEAGSDPRRMLLLTFSRRAAIEMTRRVERLVQLMTRQAVVDWSGTFHSIGARILRQHAAAIGLDPSFTILDREDAADLMDIVRDELGLSEQKRRFPRKATCLSIYSFAVNAEAPLAAVLPKSFPWCQEWEAELHTLFGAYVEAKQKQNTLDYDDLLLCWSQLMLVPEVASRVAERFDHVLVDEYQDTNALQASILMGLKPTGAGLTVVGDDAQAIYSFRAATVRNILDFPAQFSPPATVITLEQNYRSTQPILDASNAVIGQARERFTKNLFSERRSGQKPLIVSVRDEACQVDYVVARILEAREAGIALKSQAVLFRTSHHTAQLELELARRNIPFVKFGGLKFLEAAHVKDVVSVLRWAENPRDRIAAFRVLQVLPGVGPATARKALNRAQARGFAAGALERFRPPAAAAGHWQDLVRLLSLLRGGGVAWPRQVELLRAWYQPHLERLYDAVPARGADIDQLASIAGTYASRQAFLEDLTLDPPGATSDEAGVPLLDEDYLILSTIHSAKGQEWTAVYVLNVVDGCIPSDMATGTDEEIEEERRLLHVAMTRAKDELQLMLPQRFYARQQPGAGDRHMYAARARFITAEMLDRFESRAWPMAPTEEGAAAAMPEPRLDLKQRLRDMWSARRV